MKNLNNVELREGDILHCMSNGWLAKLIKFFTRSKINHTALVLNIYGKLFIVDSQIKGTNPRPLIEWAKKYNYTYEISRPKNFSIGHKKLAISAFGHTPYDFASLIFQAWYQITGKWIGKTYEEAKKRMYCSEFVAYVFQMHKWWKMSPAKLYEETRNNINFENL